MSGKRIGLVIHGKPFPQERAYFDSRKKIAFDRPKSRAKKMEISILARVRAEQINWQFSKEDRFDVYVSFFGANPVSDIDNLMKLVMDALKGIFWEDDRQIYSLSGSKGPCTKGQEATIITVNKYA